MVSTKKSLGRNAFYNVVYRVLNILFPLLTMVYVSRVLLPVGVGKVAAAQNIVSYFVILASLGLPTYGVKKIAENMDNKEKASKFFSELFIINIISSIICSIIYIMMVMYVDYFNSRIVISLVIGIQLFANIINIDWFYQGFEEYGYIMYRSLIVKTLTLISVILFVKTQNDYILYAFITSIALCGNYIFNIIHIKKFVIFKKNNLNIKHHLKPVLTLLATTIAIEIYTLADTTMLNAMKGEEIVGFYYNSSKSIAMIRVLIVAVCAVFLPRLNYYLSHGEIQQFNLLAKRGLYYLFSISVPFAVACFILADDGVLIMFGNSYKPSILAMRILSISLVTVAISNFTGYQILVSLGKEKIVLYSTIIGAIVNILLNSLLITKYAHYGASIASVISEGVIALYQFRYVKRCIPLSFSWNEIAGIIIPAVVMGIIILGIKQINLGLIIESIICCTIGTIVFCSLAYYYKNELTLLLIKKIKNH